MKLYRPNYSARLIDIYTEVFKLMLQEAGNDYRCMIGPAFGSDHSNLPSWVPDFSVTTPFVEVEAVIRRISSFTLCEASVGRHNFDRRFLIADCQYFGGGAEGYIGTCREASVRMVLSRVTCASKIADGIQIKTNDLPSMEEWSQFLGRDVWTLQEEYRGAFEISSTGRCFYVTKNGKMGLCHPQVKTGDQVWVLKNFNSPFVLRKADSESSNARLYRFIGDCYLDGTIDEETVKATKEGTCITIV
ncbi:putative heterokaryon incompatibility protein [Botrytis fragariae]|uniref:Putative heterokaryon incompatibility protein n=1 Tax=Botrytis fragariae TaxID=1964551 RepID=A0A8H6EE29_9HELO|nr:putative heterokaryon incompatibility protein [Botrytis fragariae]KAF5868907.1 putative heterokaryon incompatibility protein [Botrytis fragariae]